MRKVLIILSVLIFSFNLFAQVTTENRQFYSQSLRRDRNVVVFKPDSCTTTSPCPVLIFLPGWTMPETSFPYFNDVLTDLLTSGEIDPMLIVIPDGRGGIYTRSGYWNSVANGKFGDYIIKDLVDWIKQEYPVKQWQQGEHHRKSWIISGFSMGGSGSARLALKYPELFAGFASFSGDLEYQRCRDWFNLINSYENSDYSYAPPDPNQPMTYAMWGLASMFSADSTDQWYAQFPLEEGTGAVREAVFDLWLQSNSTALADEYFNVKGNTSDSLHIYIQVGANDPNPSFFEFSSDFSDTLNDWGITHKFATHSYGHAFNEDLATQLVSWADTLFKKTSTTIERKKATILPTAFELLQNYPNPFNPSTTIQFTIPKLSNVTLKIIDMLGREVVTLVNEELQAGEHKIIFDSGTLPSGVYFYQIQTEEFSATKKLLLLR